MVYGSSSDFLGYRAAKVAMLTLLKLDSSRILNSLQVSYFSSLVSDIFLLKYDEQLLSSPSKIDRMLS